MEGGATKSRSDEEAGGGEDDLIGRELERHAPREALERRLRRGVEQQRGGGSAAEARDGAHVDDGALHAGLLHALHHHLRHIDRRVHVHREDAARDYITYYFSIF